MGPLSLTLVLLLAADDPGYKIIHPDGTVEYTDELPPPGSPAEVIELERAPAYAFEPKADGETAGAGAEPAASYRAFRILAPASDEAVRANDRAVRLRLRIDPPLRSEDRIQIVLDGNVLSQTFDTTSICLTDLQRGTHTVQARILGPDGDVVGPAASVTFHVQAYSALFEKREGGQTGGVRQAPRAPQAPRFEYNPD